MVRILKFYLVIFGLQILLLSNATYSFAQVDPTKALVGNWEGQVETQSNNQRSLFIRSVEPAESGEWIAVGRIGPTRGDAEKEGGVKMKVYSKDNDIYIDYPGKSEARLKLVGVDKLAGTIEAVDRGKTGPRRVMFEKIKDIK